MYSKRIAARWVARGVIAGMFLLLSLAVPAGAQHAGHDTTKQAAAKPAPAKPAATQRATKKAPRQKPAAKSAPRKTQTPDTSHAAMPDTTHAAMHDTTHAPARDTAHIHMPDTVQTHMHDTTHAQMPDTMHMEHGDTMPMAMPMEGPLGISMERMGSGTTWIPDAVRLPSRHFMAGSWMLMVHGFVFGQYDEQGGPRGATQFGSLNWAMIMADHPLAGGRLQLRFMPSLDPATVGKCGYPLLLQTGETCNGAPLVDRQHPHDFFMELGALFERPVSSNLAVLLYAAPAGEPALGPVAFMHRPSAMDEPQAPLGHHWQDATHISFGVVTAGIFTRAIRLEASAFNGREPNEQRWDFDPIRLNSYSGRLTVNPSTNWSFSAGYGYLDNPESSSPPESMHRLVTSAMYGRELGADGQLTSTLIYGRNAHPGKTASQSALVESEATLDRHNTVFGRAELVQKSAGELRLTGFPAQRIFNVGALSLGYIRELLRGRDVTIGFGARGTLNFVPTALETSYGSRTPVGGMIFLRLRPYHSPHEGAMKMEAEPHHNATRKTP